MTTRIDRLGPLAGVLSGILGIAGFGSARPGPGDNSQGNAIIDFYQKHGSGQMTADTLLMVSFASFVIFAAYLHSRRSETVAGKLFSNAALAGAAVLAAGSATYFGADYALATAPSHLTPAAAQALNLLGLKLYLPVCAGGLVFGLSMGIAILAATPLTLAAIFALFLWSIVTGLILVARARSGRNMEPASLSASVAGGATF